VVDGAGALRRGRALARDLDRRRRLGLVRRFNLGRRAGPHRRDGAGAAVPRVGRDDAGPHRGAAGTARPCQPRAGIRAAAGAPARPGRRRAAARAPRRTLHQPALLGLGWAEADAARPERALVPWLALRERPVLESAVQESLLAVPYAYARLAANGQAVEQYRHAVAAFAAETQRSTNPSRPFAAAASSMPCWTRRRIRHRIRHRSPVRSRTTPDQAGWLWQLKQAPDAAAHALPVPAARLARVPGRPQELSRPAHHAAQPRAQGRVARGLPRDGGRARVGRVAAPAAQGRDPRRHRPRGTRGTPRGAGTSEWPGSWPRATWPPSPRPTRTPSGASSRSCPRVLRHCLRARSAMRSRSAPGYCAARSPGSSTPTTSSGCRGCARAWPRPTRRSPKRNVARRSWSRQVSSRRATPRVSRRAWPASSGGSPACKPAIDRGRRRAGAAARGHRRARARGAEGRLASYATQAQFALAALYDGATAGGGR